MGVYLRGYAVGCVLSYTETRRVEGVTNRGLCGRDGSASDQDTVIKVRHYYHVHRGSHYDALRMVNLPGGIPSSSSSGMETKCTTVELCSTGG